jgi:hypothetical protein
MGVEVGTVVFGWGATRLLVFGSLSCSSVRATVGSEVGDLLERVGSPEVTLT